MNFTILIRDLADPQKPILRGTKYDIHTLVGLRMFVKEHLDYLFKFHTKRFNIILLVSDDIGSNLIIPKNSLVFLTSIHGYIWFHFRDSDSWFSQCFDETYTKTFETFCKDRKLCSTLFLK